MHSLPERRYKTHMAWYSQNSIPFVYREDPIEEPMPHFRHIRVDETWVWTEGFADYLRRIGVKGEVHVIGPILFYLPSAVKINSHSPIRVAVFDVTPFNPEVEKKLGLIDNYYKSDTLIQFMQDILLARGAIENKAGIESSILLKHKRNYHPLHDPHYISFIQESCSSELHFQLVPYETNMFSLLSECNLAVVIPYSSPAYVASYLGIPAIYYDPTRELLPTYEENPLISFASGRDELIHTIREILANKHKFDTSSSGARSATIQQ
jgi:polysaccharide biosynthesis PFTS motif protein